MEERFMKLRLYIFGILMISLTSLAIAATVDDPNLVGWWNFNDGGAKDWSQYGHDGTLLNGARVVYDAERGMVLHNPSSGFPPPAGAGSPPGGHSGHVYCGGEKATGDANTWADIPTSYSVLCWIKTQTTWTPPWPSTSNRFEKEWQAIFTKGTFASGQLILTTVGTQSRICFRAKGLTDGSTDRIYGNTFIDDGYWHHIAAICAYDSSAAQTTLHLYIDGAEEYTSPIICTGSLTLNNYPVYIAGTYGQATRDGEIYMDDVRLYNRALSETEILEAIDEPIPADLTGDSQINLDDFRVLANDWMETDYTINSDTGKMVAHWDFNGVAGGTTITDSIGGYVGSIVGGASLDGEGGVELSGGLTGPYIDLGEDVGQAISKLGEYTVIIDCNWYGNSVATNGWQRLATFSQESTTEYALFTYVSTNTAYMRYIYRHNSHDEITNASSSMPSMLGRHQIAITFTPDYDIYGCAQLYIDGKQKAFHTQTVTAGSIGSTIRNYIGKGPYDYNSLDPNSDPNSDMRFYGKIYDVRIYERRLAAQDVNDVYHGWSTELYFPLEAPGNWSDDEDTNEKVVDFKDVAELVNRWLEEMAMLKE